MVFLRLTPHIVSIIAPFAVTVGLLAQASQPPIPGRGGRAGEQQQPTQPIQQQPSAPQQPTPPSTPQITIQQTNTPKDNPSTDNNLSAWILGLLTLGVGGLQLWVMKRQADISGQQAKIAESQKAISETQTGHMEAGLAVARDNAVAARVSAETAQQTLIATHRPELIVGPIEVEGFSGRRIMNRISGKTWVTNIGVLPATLHKFWSDWLFEDTLPLANPAHSATGGNIEPMEMPPGHFVPVNLQKYEVPVDVFMAINDEAELAEAGAPVGSASFGEGKKGKLFLIGCIKYRDQIGMRRRYFAFQYDPFIGGLVEVDHPNYNYEK